MNRDNFVPFEFASSKFRLTHLEYSVLKKLAADAKKRKTITCELTKSKYNYDYIAKSIKLKLHAGTIAHAVNQLWACYVLDSI